jgi:hypothetical protein
MYVDQRAKHIFPKGNSLSLSDANRLVDAFMPDAEIELGRIRRASGKADSR